MVLICAFWSWVIICVWCCSKCFGEFYILNMWVGGFCWLVVGIVLVCLLVGMLVC